MLRYRSTWLRYRSLARFQMVSRVIVWPWLELAGERSSAAFYGCSVAATPAPNGGGPPQIFSSTVWVAEINLNLKKRHHSKSETENYKLANPEAVDSVVENGIKGSANGNIFQANLHYSVAMDKNGNIRVKDCYCDSKEVKMAQWQHTGMLLYYFTMFSI